MTEEEPTDSYYMRKIYTHSQYKELIAKRDEEDKTNWLTMKEKAEFKAKHVSAIQSLICYKALDWTGSEAIAQNNYYSLNHLKYL